MREGGVSRRVIKRRHPGPDVQETRGIQTPVIRQQTSAYVSIRQHTSAYVSIRRKKREAYKRLSEGARIEAEV